MEDSNNFAGLVPSKGWTTSELALKENKSHLRSVIKNNPRPKVTKRKTLEKNEFDKDLHSDVRHFHNDVKKDLYAEAFELSNCKNVKFPRLLELACGRGGDIHKWKKNGYKNITAVDANFEAIAEARRRWKNSDTRGFRATFETVDLYDKEFTTKINSSAQGPPSYDVVSMQFAIHYIANPSQFALRALFCAIRNYLKPGGVFICTYPDGAHIKKLIDDGPFDNGFLKIDENTDTGRIKFWADFGENNSYFDDFGTSQEWTVAPDTLRQLCRDSGLEIIRDSGFLEEPSIENWPLLLDEKEFSECFRSLVVRKNPMEAWFPHRLNIQWDQLQIDNVGKYSVTKPYDAGIHACIQSFTGVPVTSAVDGTACVGCDTLYLSEYCKTVTAYEVNDIRYGMLKNNLKWYNKVTVQCINGSFLKGTETADLLYFDPPWGGKDYAAKASVDLFIDKQNICDLLPDLQKRFKTIAIKVPINYNFPKNGGLKIHRINKNVLLWVIQ